MQLYENLEGEDLGIVTTLSAAQLTSQVIYGSWSVLPSVYVCIHRYKNSWVQKVMNFCTHELHVCTAT